MKKFKIFVDSVCIYAITVEAESLDSARDKAYSIDGSEWKQDNEGDWVPRHDLDEEIEECKIVKGGDA